MGLRLCQILPNSRFHGKISKEKYLKNFREMFFSKMFWLFFLRSQYLRYSIFMREILGSRPAGLGVKGSAPTVVL
jgi:hypothetical protein